MLRFFVWLLTEHCILSDAGHPFVQRSGQRKGFLQTEVCTTIMQYSNYYTLMADGTIKQVNPFTDNEVWSVPGRAGKPAPNGVAPTLRPLRDGDERNFCAFCPDRI